MPTNLRQPQPFRACLRVHAPSVCSTIAVASFLALMAAGQARAQLGPLPSVSVANLGQPNGPAPLDSSGTASGLPVISVGSNTARTLGARGADRLNLLDYAPAGTQVDGTGGVDASSALANAVAAANTAMAAGRMVCIYVPAGTYRIKTPPPAFTPGLPGCVLGEGAQKSVIALDAAFGGTLFAWSESWAATGQAPGAHVANLRVNGSPGAAQQNAFVFYDRNENVDMHDILVSSLPGRALYAGVTKNAASAFMRESHFQSIRVLNAGSASVPAVEFNANGNAGDATSEIDVSQLDVVGSNGPSLVIRSASGAVHGLKFDQLRIEGAKNGAVAADLVTIGDPALTGSVNTLSFTNAELLNPYAGYAALRTTASGAASMPSSISFQGVIGGSAPNGQGIRIDAGRSMAFHVGGMATTDQNVVVGMAAGSVSTPQPTAMVGGNIVLDGYGLEPSWTYAVNPADAASLANAVLRTGVPSAMGPAGGATMMPGTLHADALTAPAMMTPPARVAVTGAPVTVPSNISWFSMVQTSTVATQTLAMPAAPQDGLMLRISTVGAIQALALNPAVQGWLNGSALPANSGFEAGWDATANIWMRVQ